MPLRDGDRERLEELLRSRSVSAVLAQRARIVLLSADGVMKAEIAELTEAKRSDRPRSRNHAAIVQKTLAPPPGKPGVTLWSSRLLAA